jgi:hypothetical protein
MTYPYGAFLRVGVEAVVRAWIDQTSMLADQDLLDMPGV